MTAEWINKMLCIQNRLLLSQKRMKYLYTSMWMNLGHIRLNKRSQSQKTTYHMTPLYKMSKTGKLTEIESGLVVT